jgi:hypothetical protein
MPLPGALVHVCLRVRGRYTVREGMSYQRHCFVLEIVPCAEPVPLRMHVAVLAAGAS